jgi:hypothetical protein
MKLKNIFKKGTSKNNKEINFEGMNKTQLVKVLGGGGGTNTTPSVDTISLNSSRSNTSVILVLFLAGTMYQAAAMASQFLLF